MIEINLIPEESRKKKRPTTKIDVSAMSVPSLPIISIAAWAAGVILILQLALFGLGIMIGGNYKALNAEHKSIMPKKQETEKLKVQVSDMDKKVAAIDELMVKRFSWEKKLNALNNSMIPGIWLTELQYDEKLLEAPKPKASGKRAKDKKAPTEESMSRYLVLSGAASGKGEEGTALIGRFMRSLRDNSEFYSDFSEIELGTIKREKTDDWEIMTFKITCFFKPR
jgi:hypothetical protein